MGHHCCSKQKVKRGLWSPEEDEKLIKYVTTHGHGCWSSVPKHAGLQRCGKSCRLRWINYLRPDLKRGSFTAQEERIIIDVHRILGNRWAQIAKHLPGRTDNEVKNFWNSCIKKKLMAQGLDPKTHKLFPSHHPCNTNPNLHHHHHNLYSTSNGIVPQTAIHINENPNNTVIMNFPIHEAPNVFGTIVEPQVITVQGDMVNNLNSGMLWDVNKQQRRAMSSSSMVEPSGFGASTSSNCYDAFVQEDNLVWKESASVWMGDVAQKTEIGTEREKQHQQQVHQQKQQQRLTEVGVPISSDQMSKLYDMDLSEQDVYSGAPNYDVDFMASTMLPGGMFYCGEGSNMISSGQQVWH
ncbi:unnamed protein product [Victoria cruziana]